MGRRAPLRRRALQHRPRRLRELRPRLKTGAAFSEDEHRARQPGGRAFLLGADFEPSPEVTSSERPLLLTTGRTLFQFHTRTKTGRAPELHAAAPDVWVELAPEDAADLGVHEGDLVRVTSARGAVQGRARVTGIRPGVVFIPFHFGSWDDDEPPGAPHVRSANELTMTAWDPVSHQPLFKVAAVAVERLADGGGVPAPAPALTVPTAEGA